MNSGSSISNEAPSVSGDSVSGDSFNEVEGNATVVGPNATEADTVDGVTNNDESNSDLELPDNSNPMGVDPLIQNRILVSFDITVPAYQSNELRLEVVWGDTNLTAGWVGDEFWTVSSELPTDTEALLTVSFSDNNGAIELGRFTQLFRTGSNATEAFQISANQFDTDQFDTDSDGVSNIDELIAGTDPLVDNSVSLEIRDPSSPGALQYLNLIRTPSTYFETTIPDERPYFEDVEEIDPLPPFWNGGPWDQQRRSTIDIDAAGNGTYHYFSLEQFVFGDFNSLTQEGTRTRSEGSVHWTGSHQLFNGNAGCSLDFVEFTTQTTRTAEGVITQEGEQRNFVLCNRNEGVSITYSLTGIEIAESDNCEATSGSISIRPTFTSTRTYTKAPEDTYWHVYTEDREGQFIEEFLLPSIDVTFYCQHQDV